MVIHAYFCFLEQKVIALHKDKEFGSSIDIKFSATSYLFYIVPNIANVTGGWEVYLHKEHYRVCKHIAFHLANNIGCIIIMQVNAFDVIKYTGEGDPPFCEMTLRAVNTPLSHLEFDVILNGVKKPNKMLKLAKKAEFLPATQF